MGLAVVLSGFACYQQVAPTELDRNVRPPEKCEMRTRPERQHSAGLNRAWLPQAPRISAVSTP